MSMSECSYSCLCVMSRVNISIVHRWCTCGAWNSEHVKYSFSKSIIVHSGPRGSAGEWGGEMTLGQTATMLWPLWLYISLMCDFENICSGKFYTFFFKIDYALSFLALISHL